MYVIEPAEANSQGFRYQIRRIKGSRKFSLKKKLISEVVAACRTVRQAQCIKRALTIEAKKSVHRNNNRRRATKAESQGDGPS